jgi:hypothetical protein
MELTHPIVFGFLNLLWIAGVWNATASDQVLGPIADWMSGSESRGWERHVPEWLTKPMYDCPPCMASVHGSLWWALFQPFSFWLLPFYIVCLSGAAKILVILLLPKDKEE